ncbi:L-threonylcarbamoyladenylate synthase [Singulisphaera acidiphila]|uniref:Threonylcarbamoyl-AMP synthase n=1 Tax=Singulisphaera acidiphila (strain ATCC BAA-1392 / DSM 18658 / VKM B-2454 / MOB10) TaxID=886293 RepID=L0DEA4_SINAD|nr:L-threonylcarbamoyladenylate synthase [Singulisphaera acidiphila]AGA27158.1 Sua5/YciO/YrdC/YwlC family protein [Singulisphaera acidiphila DSM 18658]
MPLLTPVIPLNDDEPDPRAVTKAAGILRRGGLVAFATETVYGLGADATNPEAVARIFQAKGRPSFNPLIVHTDRVEMARDCVLQWPASADVLAHCFWPGPLTLVLPRAANIPDVVTAGRDTVGVRIPKSRVARALIEATGRPIAAPSANRSTGISPTEAWHVSNDLDGKIDLILDSGKTGVGIESTVLDLTTSPPRVLRPGSITVEQIREALGCEVLGQADFPPDPHAHSSPGQMDVHYAPRTPTFRIEPNAFEALPREGRWVLIALGETPIDEGPPGRRPDRQIRLLTPTEAEASLYSHLQAIDLSGVDFLVIVPPPDEPRWLAIRDRIWRASRPWPASV